MQSEFGLRRMWKHSVQWARSERSECGTRTLHTISERRIGDVAARLTHKLLHCLNGGRKSQPAGDMFWHEAPVCVYTVVP